MMRVNRNVTCMPVSSTNVIQTKPFKVVAVSGNANSFGLKGIIMVAKDGMAFEAAKYLGIDPLKIGDLVIVPVNDAGKPNFAYAGFEIPRELTNVPAEVLAEIWKQTEEEKIKNGQRILNDILSKP